MWRLALFVFMLGLAATGLGCSAAETGPGEARITGTAVATQVLLDAADSGIRERARVVLRDQAEWRAFWNAAMAKRLPVPEVPAVDFSRDMVLAAALGVRSTGGHDIMVSEVRRDDDGLSVRVLEISPDPGCLVTQALTAPVVAVRVPRAEGNVTWVTAVVNRCG